jgi:hypothetical protein
MIAGRPRDHNGFDRLRVLLSGPAGRRQHADDVCYGLYWCVFLYVLACICVPRLGVCEKCVLAILWRSLVFRCLCVCCRS